MKEVIIMKGKSIILILIIATILLVSLAGCNPNKLEGDKGKPTGKAEEEIVKPVKDTKEEIMKDFGNIVESNNEPIALVRFIDENINKVEKDDATEMIKKLETIQLQYMEKYTDQMFIEDYQRELLSLWETNQKVETLDYLFFDMDKIEEIKNDNLKELMEKLIGGKYKLINMEGAFYPIIDYEAVKTYEKYLSPEMKSYLDIKSMDSNMPTILDAGFLISFDELAERLVKVEEHIKRYSEGLNYEELLRLYGAYLRLYLEGADNTLIYDYETKVIRDEVLSSYEKTAKIPDSITGDVVNKYKDIINENDNIIGDNVLSKITEIHNEAIARLEGNK